MYTDVGSAGQSWAEKEKANLEAERKKRRKDRASGRVGRLLKKVSRTSRGLPKRKRVPYLRQIGNSNGFA